MRIVIPEPENCFHCCRVAGTGLGDEAVRAVPLRYRPAVGDAEKVPDILCNEGRRQGALHHLVAFPDIPGVGCSHIKGGPFHMAAEHVHYVLDRNFLLGLYREGIAHGLGIRVPLARGIEHAVQSVQPVADPHGGK